MALNRFLLFFAIGFPALGEARHIFLNGIDISSAQNQELKQVDVRIDSNGNIYIKAPHYQVEEEDAYLPLSQGLHGRKNIEHKTPQDVMHVKKSQELKEQPVASETPSQPALP